MRPLVRIFACAIMLCSSAFASSLTITPTTTLTAETSNNTSAASSFLAQSNGNIAPSNVSKVDTHTLLYPGAKTKIYTNIMYWFGPSNHISVGYNSDDPVQVQKQVDDHVSRGIDGTIVDWYGPSHTVDDTGTQLMMRYAETLPGLPFKFAIMEDKGALLSCSRTAGCDLNAKLISDLTYIYNTYQQSPAYMTYNGQPLVFFFGLDGYGLNWDYVKANVPGNPLFIFQNQGGYTHAASDGAFSWVMINTSDPNDWKQSYLDSFYQTALNNPTKRTFATSYKGFNDTLASWSLNRIMNQNCGQTWLKTWNEVGRYYSSSRPLENMQIVTWNDYEEGTEIETGIENCVAISAALSSNSVTWSVAGNENTIDHYTVFISLDGENLMPLASTSAGIHTLDLSQFQLSPADYTLYVKAVAKPSMTNKLSGPVSYSVRGNGPIVNLSVTPSSGVAPVTVFASTAGTSSTSGSIVSTTIDFGDGTVINAENANHTYSAPGIYTVKATTYDSMNLSGTASTVVSVAANQPPVAYITVSPGSGTVPLTVTASTEQSSDPDGSVVSSIIDFGDGTVVTAATATHTYNTAGTYNVTGTVKDEGGATASAAATVTASAPSVPGAVTVAAPSNGSAVNSPVHFLASATANTGNVITAIRIYLDYTSVYTVNSATLDTYVGITPGTHGVIVQAWDNKGTVYKTSLTLTVVNKPPAVELSVSPTSTTVGALVLASMAGTTDSDGSITAYSIDFGDGVVANQSAASHSYAQPGTYLVTARATDNAGATSEATQSVTITAPAPSGSVTVTSPTDGATVGSPVHFVATAQSSNPITFMRIYVDYVSVYAASASSLDTYVSMSNGSHNVVVQAWDSTGAVFKTALTITVPCKTCRRSPIRQVKALEKPLTSWHPVRKVTFQF